MYQDMKHFRLVSWLWFAAHGLRLMGCGCWVAAVGLMYAHAAYERREVSRDCNCHGLVSAVCIFSVHWDGRTVYNLLLDVTIRSIAFESESV